MLWMTIDLHFKAVYDMKPLCVSLQVTLLRTHSAEHLILGAAKRSLPYNNLILLGRTVHFFIRLFSYALRYCISH